MVSTEVDDTWAQLRATRGGESAGNGKPVPPRFCGRPEHSRLCCSEKRSLSVGLRGMSVNSVAGSATMRRRTGRVDRRKEPKAWAFGCRARRHRCADAGVGRRRSHPLSQRLHSTRVVAGVDILWHASAHKRSPLFRRWAPALNTVRPEGSPAASHCLQGKAAGDPSSRHSADQAIRVYGRRITRPSRRPSDMLATGTHCRRRGRAGFPAGARWAHRPWSIRWETNLRAISASAAACVRCCALRWPAGDSGRAGSLCNRDSGSRTRTSPSCRCVDAWRRHTAGRRDPRGV